jgi:hypothetical protein
MMCANSTMHGPLASSIDERVAIWRGAAAFRQREPDVSIPPSVVWYDYADGRD